MPFSFSILKSKKQKKIRIQELIEETFESKNINQDFERQMNEVLTAQLFIPIEDQNFVRNNVNYFYRNNFPVIFLTLNLMRDGDKFVNTSYYQAFIDYIARKQMSEDKKDTFMQKLGVEIRAYRTKIENKKKSIGEQ